MVMKGIDISHWQADIYIPSIADEIDFCIIKATEGIGYTDPSFSEFAQDVLACNLLFGFYHFARENNPSSEARFFYNRVLPYLGKGIPVLDYEVTNPNNAKWCEEFCSAFKELSGIYPMLYTAASWLPMFNGSWLPEKVALWLAGYPYEAKKFTYDEMPYSSSPWEKASLWQFTSSLKLLGYGGRVDANYAYIDAAQWKALQSGNMPGKGNETMHCLFKPDNQNYMVYYDGVNAHKLCHPDEMKAVQMVARNTIGHDLPVFELGDEKAPWAHRFLDAISHSAPDQKHM